MSRDLDNHPRSTEEGLHLKLRLSNAVKTQADQFKTQNGRDLSYDDYVRLLLSAAETYDNLPRVAPLQKTSSSSLTLVGMLICVVLASLFGPSLIIRFLKSDDVQTQ